MGQLGWTDIIVLFSTVLSPCGECLSLAQISRTFVSLGILGSYWR